MSEAKDEVWKAMSVTLRRIRRRRLAGRIAGSLASCITLGLAVHWAIRTDPVHEVQPREAVRVVEPEPLLLAVWVCGEEGMRFEMVPAGELADTQLQMSLKPVVTTETTMGLR